MRAQNANSHQFIVNRTAVIPIEMINIKARNVRLLALAGAASFTCCLFTGCQSTLECGTWTFSGTPTGNSFPLTDTFTFNPANCGERCDCSQDPIIQMTWVYNEDEHMNVYASDQPQGTRSDANGWAIDQLNGWAYAYYSLQNNGTFAAAYGLPGSNGKPSTLIDAPGGWPANTFFCAVDVSVCYSSKTCQNKILGYYFWSYFLDGTDTGQKFITAPAWKDLDTEFQKAVAAWDAWAPTSGTEDDGTATLPNAVQLPPLSDL
jgi:hypothetical protein